MRGPMKNAPTAASSKVRMMSVILQRRERRLTLKIVHRSSAVCQQLYIRRINRNITKCAGRMGVG